MIRSKKRKWINSDEEVVVEDVLILTMPCTPLVLMDIKWLTKGMLRKILGTFCCVSHLALMELVGLMDLADGNGILHAVLAVEIYFDSQRFLLVGLLDSLFRLR